MLQYLLGFSRLGWETRFVEPVPAASSEVRDGIEYLRTVADLYGFADRWTVVTSDGHVIGSRRTWEVAASADLLVDISGMSMRDARVAAHFDDVKVRLFLDLDPGFVQWWSEMDGVDIDVGLHTHHASLADTIGAPGSPIPDGGHEWITTIPPIVLSHWSVDDRKADYGLTTVGHWRSYGAVWRDDIRYGLKAHAVREIIDLPGRLAVEVQPALAIHPDEVDDLRRLRRHGWRLIDPSGVTATPDDYRSFVGSSWAELGIAKEGYVVANTGWFSDRSACYLACGRPVIAQNTGFGRRLPTGAGLLSFTDADGAVDAVAALSDDYQAHRRAARTIAEQRLDSDVVLDALVARLT